MSVEPITVIPLPEDVEKAVKITLLKVIRVYRVVNANSGFTEILNVGKDEVWRLFKIVFRVPFNVFRVNLVVDDISVFNDVIDDTNNEIDISFEPVKIADYIRLDVENITSNDFDFKVAFHMKIDKVVR